MPQLTLPFDGGPEAKRAATSRPADAAKRPARPRNKGKPTSRAAAGLSVSATERRRQAILALIRERGDDGATDDEVQQVLGLSGNSERPRRIELVEGGLLADSGRTRATASGHNATVWVATASG